MAFKEENGFGESISVVVSGEVRVVAMEWEGMGMEKKRREERKKEEEGEGKGKGHFEECERENEENQLTKEQSGTCNARQSVLCLMLGTNSAIYKRKSCLCDVLLCYKTTIIMSTSY